MKLFFTTTACILLNIMLTAQPVKIMLVTGGHAFDTLQFLNVFEAMEGVEYMHYNQPQANRAIAAGDAGNRTRQLCF